jgi:HipA-like protein
MNDQLVVLLNGVQAGSVVQLAGGGLRSTYAETWREAGAAYPLSLSMPLVQQEYGDAVIRSYIEGLLPDRDRIARGVASANWRQASYHVRSSAAPGGATVSV